MPIYLNAVDDSFFCLLLNREGAWDAVVPDTDGAKRKVADVVEFTKSRLKDFNRCVAEVKSFLENGKDSSEVCAKIKGLKLEGDSYDSYKIVDPSAA